MLNLERKESKIIDNSTTTGKIVFVNHKKQTHSGTYLASIERHVMTKDLFVLTIGKCFGYLLNMYQYYSMCVIFFAVSQ